MQILKEWAKEWFHFGIPDVRLYSSGIVQQRIAVIFLKHPLQFKIFDKYHEYCL